MKIPTPVLVYGGALGLGAFLIYALYLKQKSGTYAGTGLFGFLGSTANAASGGALQNVGESIGGAIFDTLNPSDVSSDLYYRVNFPGGAVHAVHASEIDASGYFTYSGTRYQLQISADQKFAVPA